MPIRLRRRSVDAVDAGDARGFVDQPFDQVGDVRAAGAAIGVVGVVLVKARRLVPEIAGVLYALADMPVGAAAVLMNGPAFEA